MTLSRITYSKSTGLIITGTCFHMYFQSMTFQQKIPSSFAPFVSVLTMNHAFIIIKLLKALCNVLKSERSAYLGSLIQLLSQILFAFFCSTFSSFYVRLPPLKTKMRASVCYYLQARHFRGGEGNGDEKQCFYAVDKV